MAADHYAVLGVSREATPSEIRSAYYRIVRISHPDVTRDLTTIEHFRRATEAFKVLIDPEARERFDMGFRPILSVQDLFSRHPAGKNVMEVMMPSAPAMPQRGVDTLVAVRGKVTGNGLTITIPDGQGGSRELFLRLPEDAGIRPWCRLRQLGGSGRNEADSGDLWIVLESALAVDR